MTATDEDRLNVLAEAIRSRLPPAADMELFGVLVETVLEELTHNEGSVVAINGVLITVKWADDGEATITFQPPMGPDITATCYGDDIYAAQHYFIPQLLDLLLVRGPGPVLSP